MWVRNRNCDDLDVYVGMIIDYIIAVVLFYAF